MRILYLKMITIAASLIGAGIVIATAEVWRAPDNLLSERKVVEWRPSDELSPSGIDDAKALAELSEASARPLFRKSRRQFDPNQAMAAQAEPAAVEAPTQPAQLDSSQLVVKGILLSGETRRALMASAESPEGVWLAPGSEIAGWQIVDLGHNSVTLAAGMQRIELKLYVDNTPN